MLEKNGRDRRESNHRAKQLRVTGLLLGCALLALPFAAMPQNHSSGRVTSSVVTDGSATRAMLEKRVSASGMGLVADIIDENGVRVLSAGHIGQDDQRRPNGDTIFQIGSVTKTLTTLLLAEMVTRGEIGLDDPAQDHLPDGWQMPRRGRAITLRDLATHQSGLPSMPSNFDLHGAPDPYQAYSDGQLREFLSTYQPDHVSRVLTHPTPILA